jgi:hypothetical protein
VGRDIPSIGTNLITWNSQAAGIEQLASNMVLAAGACLTASGTSA